MDPKPMLLQRLWRHATGGALLLLQPALIWAGGVVNNCTEADLRAAMAGGGTVTFACDGTITLANTITNALDTILDGAGYQVTISGGDAVRVFYVASNVTFVVNSLTIAHGRSTRGAGIFNDHGSINATNATFYRNAVVGAVGSSASPAEPGESVTGGAVASSGVANFVNCNFTGNSAVGGAGGTRYGGDPGGPGGTGAGGALWNSGTLTAIGCTLATNSAAGGRGGDGTTPFPVPGIQIPPGAGGAGGDGAGGALFNSGTVRLVNCTLALNTGAGGAGGNGGQGYQSTPDYPWVPSGPNGSPGLGFGGLYDTSGQCYFTNCTVAFNSGTGITTQGAAMVNTLLMENRPGGNCAGVIGDLGHNLSSDLTCNFTNAGSLNNTYALVGPLANNGGLTETIALLPGSRAIDAGDTAAAPPTDQRGVARPFGTTADIGAYEYNSSTSGGPSTVVTEPTEASLRAAMSAGGTVTFACSGTISVESTISVTMNTLLDAGQHQVALTVHDGTAAFDVVRNVTLALANLAISNCAGVQNAGILRATNCIFSGNRISDSGAALRNNSGEVQLMACVFRDNIASASGDGSASGGAVANSGALRADSCIFEGNSAKGGPGFSGAWYGSSGGPGGRGAGGAIYNSNAGTIMIWGSTFTNNSAAGGAGANGWAGHHVDFGGSGQDGGSGGLGGRGEGGAIYNCGSAQIVSTTFSGNLGMGGDGGKGGNGGASYSIGAPGSGGDGGGGGTGGNGAGALFNSGVVQLINSTFAFNTGSGGKGGAGGDGGYGTAGGPGGAGGNGGSGFGGVYDESTCAITNATFASNSGTSIGGAGGSGGVGVATSGNPGASGTAGLGVGGVRTSGGKMVNSLLSENMPGGNGAGHIADLGHNLSSDGTCAFTSGGSMNNTPALLGGLGNNGGPTLTMALLPGSPAIDAGDSTAAPTADQRGFPRPAYAAADIGAYEFGSALPTISGFSADATGVIIIGAGNAGQLCRLLTGTDLKLWLAVATNRFNSFGTAVFRDNFQSGTGRFYQLVMP